MPRRTLYVNIALSFEYILKFNSGGGVAFVEQRRCATMERGLFRIGILLALIISAWNVIAIVERQTQLREVVSSVLEEENADPQLYEELSRSIKTEQSGSGSVDVRAVIYLANAGLCVTYYNDIEAYSVYLTQRGVSSHTLILWHADARISERMKYLASDRLDIDVIALSDHDLARFTRQLPERAIALLPNRSGESIHQIRLQSRRIEDWLRDVTLRDLL